MNEPSRAPVLRVERLSHRYHPGAAPAVHDVSFDVLPAERVALLGPSGCGKTTTLRAVAGLERASEGEVFIAGRRVLGPGEFLPPERRGVGMVFQDLALFPHLDVLENVAYGLAHLPRELRRKTARGKLDLVSLAGLERRFPSELSGGQMQRVALARALAPAPALLLLDEPFSSLDPTLRASLRAEVASLLDSLGTAALLVTHDREEAFAFAQRLVVMREGRVVQAGTAEELYLRPADAFVALLLGEGAVVEGDACGAFAVTPLGRLPLRVPTTGRVRLVLRPELLGASRVEAEGPEVGTVVERRFAGAHVDVVVQLGGLRLSVRSSAQTPLSLGARVKLSASGPVWTLAAG